MAGIPHPVTVTVYAEQRRADFLAWAERERLGALARPRAGQHLTWPDLVAVVAVVVVVALLLAAEGWKGGIAVQ